MDNAIRYNRDGGWIEVTTGVLDGQGVVTVRNSGGEIPAAEVGRLFEPFQWLEPGRAGRSRSIGLGLAIVRSIVRAHSGTVVAAPNAAAG